MRHESIHLLMQLSTKQMDKVSIIIPCYNQAHFLPDAINSALAQSYKNIEVIVVNDGSVDNTSEVARKFKVKLIEQENKGLAAARNAGIKAASGEWILPLDADDKIHAFFISRTIGKSDIVATLIETFGAEHRLWKFGRNQPLHSDFLKMNQMAYCCLFKKEIWDNIGGYDEQMRDGYEDWDFWIRATREGYKVHRVMEFLFHYRRGRNALYNHAFENHNKIIEYMDGKHVGNRFKRRQ